MGSEHSQGVSESLANMDVDPFSQNVVEEELGALSATALGTYVGDRLLKASGLLVCKQYRTTSTSRYVMAFKLSPSKHISTSKLRHPLCDTASYRS